MAETAVSPSEQVRDRQGLAEAPVEAFSGGGGGAEGLPGTLESGAGVTAPIPSSEPGAGASQPTARPSLFGVMANTLTPGLFEQKQATDARIQAAMEGKATALEPIIADTAHYWEQWLAGLKAPPVGPKIGPPPSVGLHAFLDPVQGEPPAQTIGKLIQAIGLFATGIGGLARGDARSGLVALTGALKGWQEGDAERADREFKDWDAKTKSAIAQWQIERQTYQDIMEAGNMVLTQRFKLGELVALQHDNTIAAEIFRSQNLKGTIDFLAQQANAAEALDVKREEVATARQDHLARQAIADAQMKQTAAYKAIETQIALAKMAADEAQRREANALGWARLDVETANKNEAQQSRLGQEADRLRDDFLKASGDYVKVRDAYGRVLASAKDPTAAGDLALIFNYMKMLDPGSVVRESEFATAASAGSFGDRIKAAVDRAKTGQRLSPAMRADFEDRSKALYDSALATQKGLEDQFRGMAMTRGLDVQRVIPDMLQQFRAAQSGSGPGGLTPPQPGMIRVMRKSDKVMGWLDPKDPNIGAYEVQR